MLLPPPIPFAFLILTFRRQPVSLLTEGILLTGHETRLPVTVRPTVAYHLSRFVKSPLHLLSCPQLSFSTSWTVLHYTFRPIPSTPLSVHLASAPFSEASITVGPLYTSSNQAVSTSYVLSHSFPVLPFPFDPTSLSLGIPRRCCWKGSSVG
jgi:hypothetical protein